MLILGKVKNNLQKIGHQLCLISPVEIIGL